ncbi:unnamed protein product [Prunus armeniaca]
MMEHRIDHIQPEQGQNLHPVNALNDMGALQRMIREMMEPEARRGERSTFRKPYLAYIDQIPLSPGFKVPNFTLFNGEDPHASLVEHIGRQAFIWYTSLPANSVQTWEQMENVFHDYYFKIQPEVTISDLAALITRFRMLKMKCRIPMEERHFIQMAQAALKISLRKRFDGMLEEQQKGNSSKGTYYKTPSSSVHLVELESEEDTEGWEEREIAVAEMAKLKHPISCKALTRPPKDQKLPPFTGGFVPSKPTQNKVYSFNLTKVDALFDEMLLQKAIETPHRDVIQEGITTGRLKLAEKPPSITTDPFPQP